MGSMFSKDKTKNENYPECLPRTAEERYKARQTAEIIYPPLSSIPDEKPKRSLRPDGQALYESIHMESESNINPSNISHDKYQDRSSFSNYYNQYNDGTFAVLSQSPTMGKHIFRV
ncbi:hypothetical protein I4U23_021157 [Adineta vaga]|nr:hypothetical protein I4U23_021157 [Adineta vaga]